MGGAAPHYGPLGERQLAVVIAVIAMRVMQTALDEIVDVLSVGHRLVTALRPVLVTGMMALG